MKQTFNKFLIGFLFLLIISIIPVSKTEAMILAMPGDSVGGGGGGGLPNTDTSNPNRAYYTGNTILTINLDKTSYVVGSQMTATASAMVDFSSSNTFNLLVKGSIVEPGGQQAIILNRNIQGGSDIYGFSSFSAPTIPGNYFLRIEATNSAIGGYYLDDSSGLHLGAGSYSVINDNGETFNITTLIDGKLINMVDTQGHFVPVSSISNMHLFIASTKEAIKVTYVNGDILKTVSADIPFTVVKNPDVIESPKDLCPLVPGIQTTLPCPTPVDNKKCVEPTTQHVTVACDPKDGVNAISGSVTRIQTKSAFPGCIFGPSAYVSDNCKYPKDVGGGSSINGGWSDWSGRVCGSGTGTENRYCNNPASKNGGQDCLLTNGGRGTSESRTYPKVSCSNPTICPNNSEKICPSSCPSVSQNCPPLVCPSVVCPSSQTYNKATDKCVNKITVKEI